MMQDTLTSVEKITTRNVLYVIIQNQYMYLKRKFIRQIVNCIIIEWLELLAFIVCPILFFKLPIYLRRAFSKIYVYDIW